MQNGFFSSPLNRLLGSILLIVGILALISYAVVNFDQADISQPYRGSISVTGVGEVMSIPDIGQFSFSVMASGTTATDAQTASTNSINALTAYLKEQGVEEKDIKTQDYNLYPKYRFEETPCDFSFGFCPGGEQIADGFEVSQTISVKVRDTAKSGALLAGVGERGATNISGLAFVIDDLEPIKAEARTKAIADAKAKAEKMADDLGVKIVKFMSFYENEGSYPEPYFARSEMSMDSVGSAMPANVPMGENTTSVTVNLTYEIE
jgi:uncharacterized protein YggE